MSAPAAAASSAAAPASSSSSPASSSSSSSSSSVSSLSSHEVTLTSADYYFDSNSHYGVHEELLKDKVRFSTWKKAIQLNAHLFQGKVVLELGAGTGILSMMAAKAGAKHVYALESGGIYHQALKIVQTNGLDHLITLINSTVEKTELPVAKVDIILCDWVGYSLLYDSSVDSLILARDKWLAPGGLVFPDKAQMHLVAIEDGQYRSQKIDYWDDVYGFQMSSVKGDALAEPLIDTCDANQLITTAYPVLQFDMNTATVESLKRAQGTFELISTAERDEWCHAFVMYFTVTFSGTHTQIRFTTSPRAEWTHWKQTVFYIPKPFKLKPQMKVNGTFVMSRGKTAKELDFEITVGSKTQPTFQQQTKLYKLR